MTFVAGVHHVESHLLLGLGVVTNARFAQEEGTVLTDPGFRLHARLERRIASLAGVVLLRTTAEPGLHVVTSARKNMFVTFCVDLLVPLAVSLDCTGHFRLLLVLCDHTISSSLTTSLFSDHLVASLPDLSLRPNRFVVCREYNRLFTHAGSHFKN